jgi:hypothetical protein
MLRKLLGKVVISPLRCRRLVGKVGPSHRKVLRRAAPLHFLHFLGQSLEGFLDAADLVE